MDTDSLEMVDALDEQLDALTESLGPLLKSGVQDTATKLTVADKARLYVLTAYGIESLLFSYLRLVGTDTKDHPVMRELTRVRRYVTKIKEAQEATPREMELDKEAAGRFIKAALAGNDKYDQERAERETREHAGAKAKFEELQKKIAAEKQIIEKEIAQAPPPPSPPIAPEREDLEVISDDEVAVMGDATDSTKQSKKRKKRKQSDTTTPSDEGEKKRKDKKKRKHEKGADGKKAKKRAKNPA